MMGARLLLAAALSFAILSFLCFAENFLEEEYFTRWYGKVEIQSLVNRITPSAHGGLELNSRDGLEHYWSRRDDYAFRIWDASGRMIASENANSIAAWSPVSIAATVLPSSWNRKFGSGWFETVSGREAELHGQHVWIEVATRGDPLGIRYRALFADFVHDVVRPLVPTFLVAIFLALASLHFALRPVMAAAAAADRIEPSAEAKQLRIPIEGLPREVGTLAHAVNNLLGRVGELVNAQNEFIGRAAHQLRTPLATMLLEVNKIDGPEARQVEREIDQMSETVDRLLELARMQGAPPFERGILDLVVLADDVTLDLQSLAASRGGNIRVVDRGPAVARGDYCTLREALRNLVANAILHHPDRPNVDIVCGPGATLCVDDDGRGVRGMTAHALFEPFARGETAAKGAGLGLAFVKRVIDLHLGTIMASTSPAGGARFIVVLIDGEPSGNVDDYGDAVGTPAE